MKKVTMSVMVASCLFFTAGTLQAQTSSGTLTQEHEKHHPDAQTSKEKTEGAKEKDGMMGKMDMSQMKDMMHECMEMHKGKMCDHQTMEKCQEKMSQAECKKMMGQMKKKAKKH